MVDSALKNSLRGLILDATELRNLTGWASSMIEDYLSILDDLVLLADSIDVNIDEIAYLTGEIAKVEAAKDKNRTKINKTIDFLENDNALLHSEISNINKNRTKITTLEDLKDRLITKNSEWTSILSDDATNITLTFSDGTDVLGLLGTTPIFEFGSSNTFLGQGAGLPITTGQDNVTIGYRANYSGGVDVDYSTIIGSEAGYNIEGDGNTIVGYRAAFAATTMDSSVILGRQAGFSLTTQDNNVIIGYRSGFSTAVANQVLIGFQAGYSLTTGTFNVAVGADALYTCSSGNQNTAFGRNALQNANSDGNTAIGANALRFLTSGAGNFAVGYNSQYNNLTGNNNMAFGKETLEDLSTGDGNVAIGTAAMKECGTDPDSNIAIGYQAGYNLESDNNTLIGFQSGYSLAANGGCVFLGYQAGYNETAANKLYISNSNTATPLIYGDFSTDLFRINGYEEIAIQNVADIGLKITGATGQTGRFLRIEDDSNALLAEITATGHFDNKDGIRTVTPQYGAGMGIQLYGEDAPEHTNQAGWYDHTGGAFERLFIKTSGDDFAQADADNGNWIIFINGAYPGAFCEIKEYISTTQVIVDGLGWDTDINSSVSPGNFLIVKHPGFVSGDGNKHEFSVGATGEFEIASYSFTEPYMAEIELEAAADSTTALLLKIKAEGYSGTIGQEINVLTGALQPADVGAAQLIQIDDSLAVAADSTTQVAGSVYITNNASDATKDAIVVLPGFTRALEVQGAEEEDPDYGYETTSGVSTDRVNSGGGGNDAFVNSAVNVQLFDNSGDDILIGSDSTFEIIQAVLTIGSSKDLNFNFYYSVTGGGWTLFTPQADNTNGFQNSGSIVFSAADLVGWSADDEDLDGNAITNAYYIALSRNYAPAVPTLPTEEYFKIFASQATGMAIDGQGYIQPRSSADADAPNSSIYYSADSSALVYKDAGGTVNDLY